LVFLADFFAVAILFSPSEIFLSALIHIRQVCRYTICMADEDKKFLDEQRAKQLEAGVNASPMQNLKSAWLNLKTGLGLEKKKEPTDQEQEDR